MCAFENYRSSSTAIRVLRIVGFVLLGIIGATGLALLFGYVVMWLWNWLMPAVFGLGVITFWQAVGIIILARLIFGGFKHHHDNHDKWSKKWPGKHSREKNMKENWAKWKYYDRFWKEEGEKAFDDYIEKRKSDQKEE